MKIRPVILCGGSGTRLWPDQKHNQPKQFIKFGNWTLFGKTLERIKNSIFEQWLSSFPIWLECLHQRHLFSFDSI